MRLKKIKLAGFKSFVDPTSLLFPGNLTGIVGPNGCGKSNVIDAVRWVMGEASAKHLRGQSMDDVIFKGSSGRKPVGQASVELVFDNSDSSLGGEYANYSEIAIRRQINRESQSSYFLNNTRCRRRDITDIFLGTGLGPRSYAIIEQGTISRLIEAKPDEMRGHLEEAAGISKYKERRRETENRIARTRENLDRVQDLCDELNKQLARLKRQVEAANQFKQLKEEQRLLGAQLKALQWTELEEKREKIQANIDERSVQFESNMAQLQSIDTQFTQQQEASHELNDTLNKVQARYYELGSKVAQIEQQIQYHEQRKQRLDSDLEQVQQSLAETQEQSRQDQIQTTQLTQEFETLTPQLDSIKVALETAKDSLAEAEKTEYESQAAWETFNQQAAETMRNAQVEQTQITHLEQMTVQQTQRQERLQQESEQLHSQVNTSALEKLAQQSQQAKIEEEQARVALQETMTQINQLRSIISDDEKVLSQALASIQQQKGRKASLETLQEEALGKHQKKINDWLAKNQLTDKPQLAQKLNVEQGWELAVETVLASQLQAICVDRIDGLLEALPELSEGQLNAFSTKQISASEMQIKPTSLLSKVSSDYSLESLLSSVSIAENTEQALSLLPTLAAHESVITKEGIWLGPDWLRVKRGENNSSGILLREQALRELDKALQKDQVDVEQLEQQVAENKASLVELERQRETNQKQLNEQLKEQSDINARLRVQQGRHQQVQKRLQQIEEETTEITQHFESNEKKLESVRENWQKAMSLLDVQADQREKLQSQRQETKNALQQARDAAQQGQSEHHSLVLRLQSITTQMESLKQNQGRMQRQHEALIQRQEQLQQELAEVQQPIAGFQENLQEKLALRVKEEEQLTISRQKVNENEHLLSELQKQRLQVDSQVQKTRDLLEKARLQSQEIEVKKQTLVEQITQVNFDLKSLCEKLPEEATIEESELALAKVERRIERLGPINLAAISEYETQSERKIYLDSQHADLSEALATLESAINKIDRETRARFKETFNKVNQGFAELFPKVFGGGSAHLELVGDDLLSAGVVVMAHPPGKRNTTIHLLSGGEKALTAVALVFSLFQLNPAPFCLLDEVDAPLDDANTVRFGNLLKSMSGKIQFIFISHNKLTIEIAESLAGVTMKEPGVSRLVSVDIDAAVALATT